MLPDPDVVAVEVNRRLVGVQYLGLAYHGGNGCCRGAQGLPSLHIMLYAVPEESVIPCRVIRSAIILNGMRHA